ncbi:ABC transporter permease [Pelolinea submarina]|uniref:NitT/TauT family transport system permease protein n=1 Tax=Pelolinea submarina TaxID=913107 RepID=A0A347ZW14_9CHLR|nr:ABC transporter permease [Pelolinea submarina]REG07191.1 NitT/TauT family transport system permease protein [Pelolinea submarina]BBB49495.1 NitT/TauT family transport system permease protein [Pelolinea submarina]
MTEQKKKSISLSSKLKSSLDFLFPFLIIGIVWEILVQTGIIELRSLPAPSTLLAKFWELTFVNGILWKHLGSSLYRLATGYLLAVLIGTALGALLAQKPLLHDMFEPSLNLLMSVPTIAWIPIFLITLGLGDKTVIIAIFTSSFFAITYNTMRGIEMIDKSIVNAAHLMGLHGLNLFLEVLLPASMLSIINGLRLAIGYAWRALVGGELLAAMIEWGLGKMVYQARYFNDASVMLLGLLIIGITGFLLDKTFLTILERNTVEKWGMTAKK